VEILYWLIDIVLILGAIAVIALVLLQKGSRGGGLGAAFGGSSDNFFGKNKGKSAEAKLERYTKLIGIGFAVLSVAMCLIIKLS